MAVPGSMPDQLVQYWVHGKGAAKIRWGSPGDFDRCVRNLAKYFPTNPQGLCNRLHVRALGVPPGQEHTAGTEAYDLATFWDTDPTLYEEEAALVPTKDMWRGRLAPIGVPTGDRRRFEKGGIGHRDLPLPLLYQLVTGEGHSTSVVVGRILGIDIRDDEAYGYGDWLDTEHTAAAQARLTSGVGGVSVDLDDLEYEMRVPGTAELWRASEQCSEDTGECSVHEFVVTKGRIAGATLVAIPAFSEARLEMFQGPDEEAVLAAFDALADEDPELVEAPSCGCGMAASAMREACVPALVADAGVPQPAFKPPTAAFANPMLTTLSGIVMDSVTFPGYTAIRGHVAPWDLPHMNGSGKSAPKSRTNYAYFHVGEIYTAEGDPLAVGKITYGGTHPALDVGVHRAQQHYDDTSHVVAVVRAGEDEFGIWVAGVLLPWVDESTRLDLGLSPLSGDWRMIGGNYEMIAALAVNVPGFPVVRERVEAGRGVALVASAGTLQLRAEPEPAALRWVDGQLTYTTAEGVTLNLVYDMTPLTVDMRPTREQRIEATLAQLGPHLAEWAAQRERRVAELTRVFGKGS